MLQGSELKSVSGVSIDSRSLKSKDAFIAIKGDRFDGHRFIPQAVRKKVSAVVVSKDNGRVPKRIPVVLVADTTKALGLLARYHRDRFAIPVIAITGSAGKTTTKEMVARVLEQRYRVLKNIATQNNHIGVPMTLLKLEKSHEAVVVELGTNHFGEIAWLTRIANPTIAVMTNIGESHLEFLGSLSGVFKEKLNIANAMKHRGTVVFNNDDSFLRRIPGKVVHHRLISFGINQKSRFRATGINFKNSSLRFRIKTRKGFELNTPAKHNVYNALAAICCGDLLNVKPREMQKALRDFRFPKGRQQVQMVGKLRIIDDSYNANPMSLRSAIETLNNLDVVGRKVLVCADMLELGAQSKKLHRQIGDLVARSCVDMLITVGNLSKNINQAARKRKSLEAHHHPTLASCCRRIKHYLKPKDTVLIKGSRAMKMDRLVETLKEA